MKVELELLAEVAWILESYAAIPYKTIEEHCIDTLRDLAEEFGNGHVLGGDPRKMEGADKAGESTSLFLIPNFGTRPELDKNSQSSFYSTFYHCRMT